MAATAQRFDRTVPAAPDTVGALRRELRRWARRQGASPPLQANVALAFSEACTVIIGPAAPADSTEVGPLMVQAWHDGDDMSVRVSHRARGAPSPPVGVGYGFGMALMTQVCDRFEVHRRKEQPGTAVLMTFRLTPEPTPERSSPHRRFRSTTRR